MPNITLSYVGGKNPRVEPLLEGLVQCEGIDIVPTHSHASEHFWRQLSFSQFEFFEMSISSFLIAHDQGHDMVAIPAFPHRAFMHSGLTYHVDSGIDGPSSLAGKRIGVGEYQQTSALWTRGVLEHDFGVSQFDLEWYMERSEELSHGGATHFEPQEGIKFHRIPVETTILQMLLNHELDVAADSRLATRADSGNLWNFVDRSSMRPPPVGDRSKLKPVFPDKLAEGKRFFEAHGYIPANHFFAIRGDIYEKYPWAAFNLYRALIDSKDYFMKQRRSVAQEALLFGSNYVQQENDIYGEDPYTFGVEANRPMLEFMIQMSHEQGFIKSRPQVEELFRPEFHPV